MTRQPSGDRLQTVGDAAARVGALDLRNPAARRALNAGIALAVLLSVGFAAVSLTGNLPDVEIRIRPGPLALAVLGMAASLILAAEAWRRLLGALGAGLDPLQAQSIWFVSNLGRYVPTSMLFAILRVNLASRAGVPQRICLASVVYEMVLFLTANVCLGAALLMDLPAVREEPTRYLIPLLPIAAFAALHPRIFHPLADRVLVRLGREPLPVTLSGPQLLVFVALYGAVTVLAGLSFYGTALLIYPVGSGDVLVIAGSFAVGTVVSLLAFLAPGGLVAREAGVALTVAQVMPAAPALAFAVLTRILQLGLEVCLAVMMPVAARRSQGERRTARNSRCGGSGRATSEVDRGGGRSQPSRHSGR